MKFGFIALLIIGLAAAFNVEPAYLGVHDTGNDNLPPLDVGISINCDTKNITVSVASNETGEPIANAMAYLFYTDYTYQALPNPGKTGADGKAVIPVPGTIRFLNALFILRVDAQGFQSREIEFAYKKCFEAPPKPPDVAPDDNGTADNQTTDQAAMNQTAPQNASAGENATAPENATEPLVPEQPQENGTAQPQPDGNGGQGASACPGAIALAALSLSLALKKG